MLTSDTIKRSVLEASESSSLTISRLLWLYIHRFSQYKGLAYIPNRLAHARTIYVHTYKYIFIYICVSHRSTEMKHSAFTGTHLPIALIETCTAHTVWSYSSCPADQVWFILVKYIYVYTQYGSLQQMVLNIQRVQKLAPDPLVSTSAGTWIYSP